LAGLDSVLAGHTLIGLDTNPFIYLFEQHPIYFPLVETIFNHLKRSGVRGVTSMITLIEVCVQPQRDRRMDLVKRYERALLNSRQVQMLSINPALARRAIEMRVKYELRVPDALQVGAALEAGATLFVTNDRRLKKITELPLLILEDYLP
jgi:predicted nucleic acid-binding protein